MTSLIQEFTRYLRRIYYTLAKFNSNLLVGTNVGTQIRDQI